MKKVFKLLVSLMQIENFMSLYVEELIFLLEKYADFLYTVFIFTINRYVILKYTKINSDSLNF